MNPGIFDGWTYSHIGGSRGDAGIYVYLESINASKFFSWPSMGFDLPIFYPWKGAMGLSDNFLLPGLIAKILLPVIDNESFIYNLIFVGALILNGVFTYFLAKKITNSTSAALFAGFVFMCFPYFKFHRGHPQLAFAFWIPLTLLSTINFIEKRDYKSATLIGMAVSGAFFTAVYYAMYSYLLAAVTLLAGLCLRIKTFKIRDAMVLGISNIPWIMLMAPAALAYIEIKEGVASNPISVLIRQSPPITAWLAAPLCNQLWGEMLNHLSRLEGMLFFGIIPLCLCLAVGLNFTIQSFKEGRFGKNTDKLFGFLNIFLLFNILIGALRYLYFALEPNTRTLHHTEWVLAQTLCLALALSLTSLLVLGWKARSQVISTKEYLPLLFFILIFFLFGALGIKEPVTEHNPAPMLYRFLLHLPGFEGLRGLSRMGLIVALVATIIATLGLTEIFKNNVLLQKFHWIFLGGLLIASGAELYSGRNRQSPAFPTPEVYKFTEEISGSQKMVALPIRSALSDGRNFMFFNSLHQYWIRNSNHRIVNGFSGHAPFYHSLTAHELDSFPSRKSLSRLGSLVGVNYVIINHDLGYLKPPNKIKKKLTKLKDEVEIIRCDKRDNCLLKVTPIINTASISAPELLLPSSAEGQTLSFDVGRLVETDSTQSVSVKFLIREDAKHPIGNPMVSLKENSRWQRESLSLPPTKYRINPFLIQIEVVGAPGVLIKNLRLN